MKSILEYMASIFIMIIISLVFTSFIAIEMQIVTARNYHTKVVEMIQNDGNYQDFDDSKFSDNFNFDLDDDVLKVTYNYDIHTPFLGTFEAKQLIGYAR